MKRFLSASCLQFCFISITFAQTPYLLKDIINGIAGGMAVSSQYAYYTHPLNVVWEKNGNIFFTAVGYNTVPSGGAYTNDVELWKSDGTQAGTVVLKDIYVGNEGSFPSDFIEINGTLYFTAYNPTSGRELWKTDGTNAGTVIVKEILPGSAGGFMRSGQFGYELFPFTVVWQNNGIFYFIANGYSGGATSYIDDLELWRSDGTDAGTYVVKDIYPGYDSSAPTDFKEVYGVLYFTAFNPSSGRELWRSDGTNTGTYVVKEIINGATGGFQQSGQWGFNYYPFNVVWQNNGVFYFIANGYNGGPTSYIDDLELWRSDGTSGGTYLVKDIYPGYDSSAPTDFYEVNGVLYFTANIPATGRELWRTDGTNSGTYLVKEIINGTAGGFQISGQWGYSYYPFRVVWINNGIFYFIANGYSGGPTSYIDDLELWRSDGTSTGTYLVKDIYTGYDSSSPADFQEFSGVLYFSANTPSSGRELWRTDGSSSGTFLVKEIISGNVGGFEVSGQWGNVSFPFQIVWQNGNSFYFIASSFVSAPGNSTNDLELWKSDGTPGGTTLVKDINPGNEGSYPSSFHGFNGTLYFTAYNASSGRELWKSDGTTGGTQMVAEIMNGNVGGFSVAAQFVYETLPFNVVFNIGSNFYFVANDYASVPGAGSYENNVELWKSDGTPSGTSKVMEIFPGTNEGSYPLYFTNNLGKVFFTANNPSYGREIWVIDVPVSDGPDLSATEEWKVFPNPASNLVNVTYKSSLDSITLESISVSDVHGRDIFCKKLQNKSNVCFEQLDVSDISTGVYFIKLTSSTTIKVRMFVKE